MFSSLHKLYKFLNKSNISNEFSLKQNSCIRLSGNFLVLQLDATDFATEK